MRKIAKKVQLKCIYTNGKVEYKGREKKDEKEYTKILLNTEYTHLHIPIIQSQMIIY